MKISASLRVEQAAAQKQIGSRAESHRSPDETLFAEQIPLRTTSFVYTRREPLGVVAGIGAWNSGVKLFLIASIASEA